MKVIGLDFSFAFLLFAPATALAMVHTERYLDPTAPLVVEEGRLPYTLSDNQDPFILHEKSFAE